MTTERFAVSLTPRIRAILSAADLDSVSAKGVRKELVNQGIDEGSIKQNKSAIDAVIADIFNDIRSAPSSNISSAVAGPSNHATSSHHPPTSPQVPLRQPGYNNGAVKRELSPSASDGPVPPYKKPKAELKASNVASSGTTRPVSDEAYARQLQAELNGEGRRSRGGSGAPSKAKKAGTNIKKKMKSEARVNDGEGGHVGDGSGEDKKKRGGGGVFNKPMLLSEPLSALTGEAQLSRPQTVKALWAHIKGHELQDPVDKRYILCDDAMRRVFGQDRVHMMTMNKELGRHLFNPDEIVR